MAAFVSLSLPGSTSVTAHRQQLEVSAQVRRMAHRRGAGVQMAANRQSSDPPPYDSSKETTEGVSKGGNAFKNFFVKIGKVLGFIETEKNKSMLSKLRNYGLAAVLSYGLFDGLTYTIAFFIAVKSYTGSTGEVLSWKTLPAILAIMYGINNISRPLRLAAAVLVAPSMDKYVVKPAGRFIRRVRARLFGTPGDTNDRSDPR
eukprot:Plantae.Rhodophyta-Purpureofilum_apyrenoidigerum.ctg1571.p1 GENE.Plantae.Rhodophyta-Purpureofilum_apyrenoidigerum.ctg1571~~Plantae.Rhodophyta-Purpureofilum_apyrenoidigerum.ctg1571.p1  ORF type:complete len:202 (+),score=26.84 Plantae.Rhodophyta-Purpureofilum_apyrenoidigerum.ctg1571:69-674(+)